MANTNGQSNGFAVHVRNVTKTFGTGEAKVAALKGVDFDARMGEMLMIVGPSGCGKTTLLSVIAGTLAFNGGEIDVFGTPLHGLKDRDVTEFRKKNVGFIFQQFNLIPTLSLVENVSVPLLINGVSRSQAEKKASELLDRLGLAGRGNDRPSLLSGGQQQRVAIARALVHDPRLVICDEPTSALDKDTGGKIMELLRDIGRSPNRCVIVVTHDNRVFKYADRMTEMEDGRVQRVHESYSQYEQKGEH
ncbi:ABC transporter ATP-binding protein [Pedosphaera parvula]|uniref:ABC transporter related-protein n=1 Tax=Pedosphaera parvula (strain Ellin514) TaxID=320771 RepID=B9XCA5_PEDPL|nr:ABC transporter ATP-binding protein [Pedosphaera parvula]EEF62573.1 ABC transporter related-protein [Pedosphaera parvula Ellin514]